MTMRRIDGHIVRRTCHGINVFSCVRNEMLRLPHFLRYYRSIGASGFVIIDNGSTDGTTEFLLEQSDVILHHTNSGYQKSESGIIWIRELIRQYASGQWVVVADADEFLSIPVLHQDSLSDLCQSMDQDGHDAMCSLLLDMYSDKPFDETVVDGERNLWDICPYYEMDSITKAGFRLPPHSPAAIYVGGVRFRLFGVKCCLDKVNLFRASDGISIQRGMHSVVGSSPSPTWTVTRHFKFLSDFRSRVDEAVLSKEYWRNSFEYACYKQVLDKSASMTAVHKGSMRFTTVEDFRMKWVV